MSQKELGSVGALSLDDFRTLVVYADLNELYEHRLRQHLGRVESGLRSLPGQAAELARPDSRPKANDSDDPGADDETKAKAARLQNDGVATAESIASEQPPQDGADDLELQGLQGRRGFDPAKAPLLRQKDVAEKLGIAEATLATRMAKIEAALGTYMVEHTDEAPFSERKSRTSCYPEQTHEFQKYSPEVLKSQRTAKLTADGRVWAAHGRLVLNLIRLTSLATKRLPGTPRAKWSLSDPFGKSSEKEPGPTRHRDESKLKYQLWLQHQDEVVEKALTFSRSEEGSPFDLLQFLPVNPEYEEPINPDR